MAGEVSSPIKPASFALPRTTVMPMRMMIQSEAALRTTTEIFRSRYRKKLRLVFTFGNFDTYGNFGNPADASIMITRRHRTRPRSWSEQKIALKHSWMLPLIALEWSCQWLAFVLGNWAFLELLEYLGTFSVLVAVIFYFHDADNRLKQRHYQAWQVINTAQGKGGSGGRIEALQELNADRIPLVGVDVSGAFLQGINLAKARLLRANFDSADLRDSDFHLADFTDADLKSANFRGSNLSKANFLRADLSGSDLEEADLADAKLAGANLEDADLSGANLAELQWREIASAKNATIEGVKNAPLGFVDWAKQKGALTPLKAGEKSK